VPRPESGQAAIKIKVKIKVKGLVKSGPPAAPPERASLREGAGRSCCQAAARVLWLRLLLCLASLWRLCWRVIGCIGIWFRKRLIQ